MIKALQNKRARNTLHNRIIRHLREWHRRLGIMAAFFLIFLSISGIALNHTDGLHLSKVKITNQFLLDYYGIKPPTNIRFYQDISITDNQVWLKDKLILDSDVEIITAGKFSQFWFVVADSQLSLFSEQGELVDQISPMMGLPKAITAISTSKNHLIVNTPTGYFQTDENFIEWLAINTLVEPNWIKTENVAADVRNNAINRYQSQYLTLERIFVDAHSGRILGTLGVLLMDLVAIILVLLSISGLYIWLRYNRAKR